MIGQLDISRHKVGKEKPQGEEGMLRKIIIALVLVPSVVLADGWKPLSDDAAIQEALADRTVRYDALTFQIFGANGDTQYITERASSGRWAARGGQYCSVWPPSDIWTCYDFEVNGNAVRFIGSDNTVSVGTYEE